MVAQIRAGAGFCPEHRRWFPDPRNRVSGILGTKLYSIADLS